jgi:hypothetical protein
MDLHDGREMRAYKSKKLSGSREPHNIDAGTNDAKQIQGASYF